MKFDMMGRMGHGLCHRTFKITIFKMQGGRRPPSWKI